MKVQWYIQELDHYSFLPLVSHVYSHPALPTTRLEVELTS